MKFMAAGNELESSERESISESRQRLRPWLISKLDNMQIPGLRWVNCKEMTFQIPWKHGGKQDWVQEHAQIFMEWAKHTGKYREGIDQPSYAKWKTNLRCALNKAPDIKEITELTRKDEPNPYKVYKFLARKKKTSPLLKNPNEYVAPPKEGANTTVPTFIQELSSGGQQLVTNTDTDRLPSDLNSVKSGDLMEMGPNALSLSDAIPSQEGMEFEEESPSPSSYSQSSPTYSFIQHQSPYPQPIKSPRGSSDLTPPAFPVPDVQIIQPSQEQPLLFSVKKTESTSPSVARVQVEPIPQIYTMVNSPYVHPSLHSCVEKHGSEMNVEVLYRSCKVMEFHVDHDKGCRITRGRLPVERESEIPDVLKDVLYGVDAKDRALIDLPEWRRGLCNDDLLPSVNDLLRNLQRGLILECHQGSMSAMRLCKTSIYYSSITGSESHKLVRHDTQLEKTLIFDMAEFTAALENYKANKGDRPNADIYLFVGQKGSIQEVDNILIVIKVTSCRALHMLKDVFEDKLNSIHISDTTDMDKINDCVHGELQDPSILVSQINSSVQQQSRIKYEPSQFSEQLITTQFFDMSPENTTMTHSASSNVSSHVHQLQFHYNSPENSQQYVEHMQDSSQVAHFAQISDDSNSAMHHDIGGTTTVEFDDACMSLQE